MEILPEFLGARRVCVTVATINDRIPGYFFR